MSKVKLGDLVSATLASVGMTVERYQKLRSVIGLTSECGCEERQAILNRIEIPVPTFVSEVVSSAVAEQDKRVFMHGFVERIINREDPVDSAGPVVVRDIQHAIEIIATGVLCNPAVCSDFDSAQWLSVHGVRVELRESSDAVEAS